MLYCKSRPLDEEHYFFEVLTLIELRKQDISNGLSYVYIMYELENIYAFNYFVISQR